MNETMSLLLATAILAAGGIGLFMLKSDDNNDNDYKEDNNYTEDIILDELEDLDDDYDYDYKPKAKPSNKTKRNRKSGGSRRRY
jgi:hypothetical protein